jgi:hypothetical protein
VLWFRFVTSHDYAGYIDKRNALESVRLTLPIDKIRHRGVARPKLRDLANALEIYQSLQRRENGNDRMSTPLTTEKIAVFVPIPITSQHSDDSEAWTLYERTHGILNISMVRRTLF